MRFGDLRPLLDAAYEARGDEESFLGAIARETNRRVCEGAGAFAMSFETTRSGRVNVRALAHAGVPRALVPRFVETFMALPRDFVRASLSLPALTESAANGREKAPSVGVYLRHAKVDDLLITNGYDARGMSVLVAGHLPRVTRLSPAETTALTQVAAHAIAALRLRLRPGEEAVCRMGPDGAPRGAIRDDAAAEEGALRALRRATRALYDVRAARADDVPAALGALSPRVHASWSVVGRFEVGGEEHAVVRKNPAPAPRAQRGLTERERQVVGLVDAGHSLKLVAYELGIAYATVRVLHARAAEARRLVTQPQRPYFALRYASTTSRSPSTSDSP